MIRVVSFRLNLRIYPEASLCTPAESINPNEFFTFHHTDKTENS